MLAQAVLKLSVLTPSSHYPPPRAGIIGIYHHTCTIFLYSENISHNQKGYFLVCLEWTLRLYHFQSVNDGYIKILHIFALGK